MQSEEHGDQTADTSSASRVRDTATMPALWNPNAAANWSLLFTPAFGSYLHAQNWLALGNEDKAKSSMVWFYLTFGYLAACVVGTIILPDSQLVDRMFRLVGTTLLIAWYLTLGREQAGYVKEQFGVSYERRSWLKPIFTAIASLFAYLIAAAIIVAATEMFSGSSQGRPGPTAGPAELGIEST